MKTVDTFDRFRLIKPQTFKSGTSSVSDIELVTTRKEKPEFDINQEITNRTFIRPLPPKGHIVRTNLASAPLNLVQDKYKAEDAEWDINYHSSEIEKTKKTLDECLDFYKKFKEELENLK